jgi:polyhydroxyalkanoate synthesis repressor PhaR
MIQQPHKDTVVIKKYANRRLYDTEISNYVTLSDVCTMVKKNIDFIVVDAKTGEDLTRMVLTQIIFEEESKGDNILPINFLRQIIGFYDNGLRGALSQYLEVTMEMFNKNQDHFQKYTASSPFRAFEEIAKQNLAFFETAMKMMSAGAPFPTAPRPDVPPQETD